MAKLEGKKLAQDIIANMESLQSKRAPFEQAWREAARYAAPDLQDFSGNKSKGSQQNYYDTLDSTAANAIRSLATTLHSHLTNQADQWFDLKASRHYKNDKSVAKWLAELRDVLLEDVFTNPDCKFGTAMHEFYIQLCLYGTGIVSLKHKRDRLLFKCVSLRQCFIAENDDGEVDTLYRLFMKPAKDILADFGDSIDDDLRKKMEAKPFEEWEIIHAVEPRAVFNPESKLNTEMPYRSVYILKDKKMILSESGFNHFPYVVVRWSKNADEVYGRSPVMSSMPDIRMINSMKKTVIQAGQLKTFPAMQARGEEFAGRTLKIKPGVIIPTRSDASLKPLFEGADPGFGVELMNLFIETIESNLGSNFVGENKKKYMTATEVLENKDRGLFELSAVVQRIEEEGYKRFVELALLYLAERHNNESDRFYMSVPPVENMNGDDIKIHYVSPVVRAVRSLDVMQIRRWLDMLLGGSANPPPELLASIDWRGIAVYMHSALDLDVSLILDDKRYQSVIQAQEASAQQADDIEDLQGIADADKNLALSEQAQGGDNGR